jgi:hypothetical protein
LHFNQALSGRIEHYDGHSRRFVPLLDPPLAAFNLLNNSAIRRSLKLAKSPEVKAGELNRAYG